MQHDWAVTPREAVARQRELAPQIVDFGAPSHVRLVAGVDVAVGGRFGRTPGRGAVVVLECPSLEPLEQSVIEKEVQFPYVPGLLSFREIPVLLPAFAQMKAVPDLLMVDGQGRAHPRRMGLASHLGLLLDLPTIGCAKSKLIGEFRDLGVKRGSVASLTDQGEVIGAAVRTKDGVNPIYVSVGHRIGLDEAIDWTLRLSRGYRLPEPTRLAHQAAAGLQLVTSSTTSSQ
jgi:deoxyribonuclease V